MVSRKVTTTAVIIVILAIGAASYLVFIAPATGPAPQKITPKVVLIEASYLAPFYYAVDSGLFAKYNIFPQTSYVSSGADVITAFSTGAADLGVCNSIQLALANSKGIKIRSVAMWDTLKGWGILVRPDSPVQSVQDLAGKKIGISSKSSTTDAIVLAAEKKYGIQASEVPLGGGGLAPGLQAGTVDAITYWPPGTLNLVAQGSARFILDASDQLPTVSYPGNVYCATQDFINNHPQGLENFLRAVFTAQKDLQQHAGVYTNLVINRYKVDNQTAQLLYKNELMTMYGPQPLNETLFQQSVLFQMSVQAQGVTPPPISDLYTNQFVNALSK